MKVTINLEIEQLYKELNIFKIHPDVRLDKIPMKLPVYLDEGENEKTIFNWLISTSCEHQKLVDLLIEENYKIVFYNPKESKEFTVWVYKDN